MKSGCCCDKRELAQYYLNFLVVGCLGEEHMFVLVGQVDDLLLVVRDDVGHVLAVQPLLPPVGHVVTALASFGIVPHFSSRGHMKK